MILGQELEHDRAAALKKGGMGWTVHPSKYGDSIKNHVGPLHCGFAVS
jgi:hypothetical protein